MDRRAADAVIAAAVGVPCQARWRQGARRRFFGYGRLGADASFKAPLRSAVALPVGGRANLRESWRPGMRVLEYRAPDGQRIDFQVYAGEVGLAGRFLRVPDSDWVRPFGNVDGRSKWF
ncbi:hypothetical protein [Streptomyces sp. NBC_00503]|uniref:hypothetical protein n=1 Tax=Streptomyces sp. NBC_00503 TaxID=2903659 RepID=UPI002E7FE6BA|nr:hypothetical protein [Streptomyces sp. NBC_00503]WUD80549.1 hypothetical protein OG490_08285 [Streptomyces sp. NBC_00503]